MRRSLFFIVLLIFVLACSAPLQENDVQPDLYDPEADVLLYLKAQDADTEKQALERLREQKTSHATVRTILKKVPSGVAVTEGLQPNLELKMGEKKRSYALYVPKNLEPGKSYPLAVVLHGMGGSGETTLPAWVERLQDEFIIACPTYPMGAWWSRPAEDFIRALVENLKSDLPVDPNRIILAGLSNGAIGAYLTGMFHPDLFAGVAPIAGAVTERYMHFLVNLNNTPVYMIQGKFDPIFPVQYSRRIWKILSDMKYPVEYQEHDEKGFAHGGHFLPTSEVAGLYEWMKTQKRRVNPRVIRMTREENHMSQIQWVKLTRGTNLAALQLPGPEAEKMNVHDGKIATLFAVYEGDNYFNIMGQNLEKYEVYLSEEMIDFEKPVRVSTQKIETIEGKLVPGEKFVNFHKKVERDLEVLLSSYKQRRDPYLLYDAKISVALEKDVILASRP